VSWLMAHVSVDVHVQLRLRRDVPYNYLHLVPVISLNLPTT
jgi:hypothetical protein